MSGGMVSRSPSLWPFSLHHYWSDIRPLLEPDLGKNVTVCCPQTHLIYHPCKSRKPQRLSFLLLSQPGIVHCLPGKVWRTTAANPAQSPGMLHWKRTHSVNCPGFNRNVEQYGRDWSRQTMPKIEVTDDSAACVLTLVYIMWDSCDSYISKHFHSPKQLQCHREEI